MELGINEIFPKCVGACALKVITLQEMMNKFGCPKFA